MFRFSPLLFFVRHARRLRGLCQGNHLIDEFLGGDRQT